MSDIPKLSKKLGVEYEPAPEVTAVVPYEEHVPSEIVIEDERIGHEKEDYDKTRKIYDKVTETGLAAIENLSEVAKLTNEPRAYEVLATMIKSLNETAKHMTELHASRIPTVPVTPSGNVNIDKAVFVGSQADLLKVIKDGITGE